MLWRILSGTHLMSSLPTAPLSLGHHCLEDATLHCNLGLILFVCFSYLAPNLVSTKSLKFLRMLMFKPQPKPSVFLGDGQSVLPYYLPPLIHFQLLLHDLRA